MLLLSKELSGLPEQPVNKRMMEIFGILEKIVVSFNKPKIINCKGIYGQGKQRGSRYGF